MAQPTIHRCRWETRTYGRLWVETHGLVGDSGKRIHCVQCPWKTFRTQGVGGFRGPVVVGVPGVEPVIERLHQAVELGTKPILEFVQLIAFPLPPLGSSVLEPDL